jgi:hypothetical protein
MSRDITEQIDDICRIEYGHTNWVFADTLSDKELNEIKDKKLGDKMPSIIFYYDEHKECSWCGWDYPKDLEPHEEGLLCKSCSIKVLKINV